MKKHLIILISFSIIYSCSHPAADNLNAVDTSATRDNLISQTEIGRISINANFPFGCADLTKFNYPMRWEADEEYDGHLKTTNGQEFENIGKCFDAINKGKPIVSPRPKSVELLQIGDQFKKANNLDTVMQMSIDSCRYRLPNMGSYECYYSYAHYGNLLLLDPKTNTGKLLNIYADDLGGDTQTILRYFYIDKNGITIYEAYCSDSGCSLNETHKIVVNTCGEIVIHQLTK